MIIVDYVGNLALDAGKNHFKCKLDEQKIKTALTDYMKRQRNYNEACSLAEEIDFQGLMDYVCTNLLDDVSIRAFHPDKRVRTRIREQIIDKAVAYSQAETDEAKKKVATCISICIVIIRGFYDSISVKEYLIASAIVDAVDQNTRDALHEMENRLLAKIDESGSLFSIPKATSLAKDGDIKTIENGFREVLKHISTEHPLFPDYGYDFSNGHMLSVPLTTEAKRKYPEKYMFTGPIRAGGKYFTDPKADPLDYSYRHQIPIVMEVIDAKKYLGDVPVQDEVQDKVGGIITANPPQFPPAFPCAILAGTQICFEYILFRTQEILDDGMIIIGNKEQGGSLYFEIRVNPQIPNKPGFYITLKNPSNREVLQYVKFMEALERMKDLHIRVLSEGKDLVAGHIETLGYKSGFPSIEEEIDFIERICCIEDYFDIKLEPEGDICQQEYYGVKYISDLIRNETVDSTWKDATFKGTMSAEFRQRLIDMKDEPGAFSYVGISKVKLFNAEFEVTFMRTFLSARFADYEKLLKKTEILEDGDTISLKFVPAENNKVVETLQIPEELQTT